ncbi:NAD/NADP octopine/nopaline dehydrogenase [Aspergillus aurantiobrunneus]
MASEIFDATSSVTVIGAGPCGCAFAADLASRGKSVLLYGHPDHRGALPMIEKNDGWLSANGDDVSGKFQIKTTSDLYLATRHSSFLVSTVPSYGQDTILRTLSQFDLRNHTLIINVGNFSYLAARQKVNCHAIMETDISPYAVRITGDTVFVKGVKKALTIWAEPPTTQANRHSQQAELTLRRQVESIFSQRLVWCQNLLQVGLNNINPVVHCPAALMNAGWIESTKGDFYFYAQGMSPSVAKVTEKIDQERLAIGRAYGFSDLVDITTYMNRNYQHDREFADYHDFAVGSVIHNKTKSSPTSLKHRYLLEDILFCMVPWYELGTKAGLALPTMGALIEMASVVSGFDYFEHGRTLKSAGLAEASKEQITMALGGPVDGPKTADMLGAPLADPLVNAGVNRESMAPLQRPQVVA